ncbi:hypothetical protein ABFV43_18350 [Pseudomonas fulva]|uniref:hypothetical protein n=1 Tax=Pseudomonas fulva TaxID=47880 RepID=UPI0034D4228B
MSDQQGLDTSSYRVPLYTHADPGEVERLRIERGRMDQALVACANERDESRKANTEFDAQVANDFKFIDDLRAQLAEAQALLTDISKRHWSGVDFDLPADLVDRIKALSTSAEPSAPVEIDERAEFEQACRDAATARGRELDPEALRRRADGSHVNPLTECGWWARAALGRKPQVKR